MKWKQANHAARHTLCYPFGNSAILDPSRREGRRGGSEKPWFCVADFHQLCLCRGLQMTLYNDTQLKYLIQIKCLGFCPVLRPPLDESSAMAQQAMLRGMKRCCQNPTPAFWLILLKKSLLLGNS